MIPSQSKRQPAGNHGTALPLWDHEFRSYRGGDIQAVGVYEPAAS